MLLEEGRICIKKFGRDAGSRAVITKVSGKNVMILTAIRHKKERKCNPAHLELLSETVDLKNKEAIAKALGLKSLD
ncbi:MAG: hypothetical protein QXN59_00040 [Candidatus Micrarchaeaceae archaeon]